MSARFLRGAAADRPWPARAVASADPSSSQRSIAGRAAEPPARAQALSDARFAARIGAPAAPSGGFAARRAARPRLGSPAAALLALLALAACGTDDPKLEGDRTPVRQTPDERRAPAELAAALAPIGDPTRNADWAQPNASPTRAVGHLEGPASPTLVWSADIGAGAGGEGRVTGRPIVAEGRVFALDAASQVSAFDAGTGDALWRAGIAPDGEDPRDGFGGGLAFAEGRVFASTGFGEVVALSSADGAILWRRALGAPMRAAPAVSEGRVIVVTRDSSGYALDAATGAVLWRAQGAPAGPGALGGASPAVSGGLAVLPFSSGELAAVRSADGRRLWSDVLSGGRRGGARAAIGDVSGDPVIFGFGVFASSQSGLLAAIDGRSGRRGWLREIASTSPVWVAGRTLFALDVDGRLLRLAAATGETLWSADLPAFRDPEDREGVIGYAGPVVAGGRVWITSTEDALIGFDPETGEEVERIALPGGSSTGPVVADGRLYVVADDGELLAFR